MRMRKGWLLISTLGPGIGRSTPPTTVALAMRPIDPGVDGSASHLGSLDPGCPYGAVEIGPPAGA